MATGFKRTESNEVIKRLIKEREAKGLHSRNVPLPPRVAEGRRKKLEAAQQAAQPSTGTRMREGLKAIRRLGR